MGKQSTYLAAAVKDGSFQMTEFIGRQEIIAETRRSLELTRHLTLVGPGGIGKSRLAIETAAEMASRFRHGVYFIPLAPVPTADSVVQAFAEEIGLSLATNEEPLEQLLDFLRGKQQLLVVAILIEKGLREKASPSG